MTRQGPGGPLGDTGLLGWTAISHHVGGGSDDAPECRIHPFYNAGEQASGLTSYYPGDGGGCHDGGHDLLVTRSQELWGPVSFTYSAMGGAGSATDVGADENNVNNGFMGAALRKVSDGTYVASVRHPCTGGCAGQIEQVVMAETGDAGEKYTIDIIDNNRCVPDPDSFFVYKKRSLAKEARDRILTRAFVETSGGWGWMLVNDFDIHQGLPPYVTVSSVSVDGRMDSAEENVATGAMCKSSLRPQSTCRRLAGCHALSHNSLS